MDKMIFQFNVTKYDLIVTKLPFKTCEHLAKIDTENVTKFTLDSDTSLQELLNEDMLDIENCYFRAFI